MSSYPGFGKYQGNKYLGDPLFAPVMEELNRRKAIAYTHPFRAEPLYSLLPDRRAMGIVLSTDTTVTIESVLDNNISHEVPRHPLHLVARRGTMPYIDGPVGRRTRARRQNRTRRLATILRFYYDTAQAVQRRSRWTSFTAADSEFAHPVRERLSRQRGKRRATWCAGSKPTPGSTRAQLRGES